MQITNAIQAHHNNKSTINLIIVGWDLSSVAILSVVQRQSQFQLNTRR